MANAQIQLEDLILSSRALTLEEKQLLLKRLDTIAADKQAQLREILTQESDSFQKFNAMALDALKTFTQSLKFITADL